MDLKRTFSVIFTLVAYFILRLVTVCVYIVLTLQLVECFIIDGSTSCRENTTSVAGSSNCSDSGVIDCETADTIFNICCDKLHAKDTCRRYCNLCSLVDGHWSEWSNWTACDVSCGDGNLTRIRTCTDPAPAEGGLNCSGPSIEHEGCSLDPCPVHGGWSSWESWGKCSVTCGVGIQRRDRTCSNPAPLYYGDHCFGDSNEDDICYSDHCSDGGWSTWTNWGSCSTTCGTGIRNRERFCNNPPPSLLGYYCQGPSTHSDTCESGECNVIHGGWSVWTDWGSCSVTCGTGIRTKARYCTNPPPSMSGNYCQGSSTESSTCQFGECNVTHGDWSAWTSWGSCPKTCGRGIRTRERYCNNPAPSMSGRYCQGSSSQADICGSDPTPVYEINRYNDSCCVNFKGKDDYAYQLCDGDGLNVCSSHKGRLEIYHVELGWRPVCSGGWSSYSTNVFCRSIGYCSGTTIASIPGTGDIFPFNDFNCTGNESSLFECTPHSKFL